MASNAENVSIWWRHPFDDVITIYATVKYTIIDSDNGLSLIRQANISIKDGLLLSLGTNFSEIYKKSEIHNQEHAFEKKCHLQNDRHFTSAPMCWHEGQMGRSVLLDTF